MIILVLDLQKNEEELNLSRMKRKTLMLSKVERTYLRDKERFPKNYQYVLESRIKKKLNEFYNLEVPLIEQNSKVTEFHKNLTKNNKIEERTRSDSNRRPNAPQAFALSMLCNESENSDNSTLNLDCYY